MPRFWIIAFTANRVTILGASLNNRLRADRRIGLRVGDRTSQPALSIMPMEPAELDAAWHADFVGVVEILWDRSGEEVARRRARAYACAPRCRFVLLVHRDVVRVEALVPENGWVPTEAPLEGAVRILDTDVPVTDWYR